MKGCARLFGAQAVGDIAWELESKARDGDVAHAPAASARLRREVEVVVSAIAARKATGAP